MAKRKQRKQRKPDMLNICQIIWDVDDGKYGPLPTPDKVVKNTNKRILAIYLFLINRLLWRGVKYMHVYSALCLRDLPMNALTHSAVRQASTPCSALLAARGIAAAAKLSKNLPTRFNSIIDRCRFVTELAAGGYGMPASKMGRAPGRSGAKLTSSVLRHGLGWIGWKNTATVLDAIEVAKLDDSVLKALDLRRVKSPGKVLRLVKQAGLDSKFNKDAFEEAAASQTANSEFATAEVGPNPSGESHGIDQLIMQLIRETSESSKVPRRLSALASHILEELPKYAPTSADNQPGE